VGYTVVVAFETEGNLRYDRSILKRAALLLLLGTAMLCARMAFALPQAGSAPPIRVESGEVLVPTTVFSRPDYAWISGLTAADFHLFEDGKEQKIQKVTVERQYCPEFVDNFGVKETECASTPGQKWAVLFRKAPPFAWRWGIPPDFTPPDLYLIAYVPPDSAEGSCHEIRVKVKQKDDLVFTRGQYCNTTHPASDPLAGTSLSKQMEDFATSGNVGRIPLALQAGFFYTSAKAARVYITIDFSSGAAKEFRMLAMAYRRDGALASRSSDTEEMGEGDSSFLNVLGWNHYEAQMELLPGDYDLRSVLSEDSKFGKAEMPLTVDSYDSKQLGISSIFVCKQFHDHRETTVVPDPKRPSTLSDFIPLVSKGREFTPTGDTNFRKKEIFFVYYEVYEPLLASVPATAVQTRLRIINAKTGRVGTDTGWQSAESWMEPDSSVIHITPEVGLKNVNKGSYRIEVQASDSAGRTTGTRTATFSIE
jgi:hypothetical protein